MNTHCEFEDAFRKIKAIIVSKFLGELLGFLGEETYPSMNKADYANQLPFIAYTITQVNKDNLIMNSLPLLIGLLVLQAPW